MKIIKEEIPSMTIEEFAEKYDLTLRVRSAGNKYSKLCGLHVSFDCCTSKKTGEIIYAVGSTMESAIKWLAEHNLSFEDIVIHKPEQQPVFVTVPRLTYTPPPKQEDCYKPEPQWNDINKIEPPQNEYVLFVHNAGGMHSQNNITVGKVCDLTNRGIMFLTCGFMFSGRYWLPLSVLPQVPKE